MKDIGLLDFKCNICGAACRFPVAALGRETPSCEGCGSTVRMRAMIYAVSLAVFGRPIALPDFPVDPSVTGVGLSDWPRYADVLSTKLGYRNTWYHVPPHFDITAIAEPDVGSLDFVLSTDVFEHVTPPVSRAFDGAMRLLKPYGALVFSVPFSLEGTTVEHFPDLHEFELETRGDRRVLVNTTKAGLRQEFDQLVFHGGEGDTLEFRLFSRSGLLDSLESAGFEDVQVLDAPYFEFGIWHEPANSVPIIARREAPRVRVLGYGPRWVEGDDNAAPAIWMRVDPDADGAACEVWIDDVRTAHSSQPGLITAPLPAAVLGQPGPHFISIHTPGHGRPIAVGLIRVI